MKWALIHFVWLLGAPPEADPGRYTIHGIPSRGDCEEARIVELARWESRTRHQKAYCTQESET
jgi:hypothetical protein